MQDTNSSTKVHIYIFRAQAADWSHLFHIGLAIKSLTLVQFIFAVLKIVTFPINLFFAKAPICSRVSSVKDSGDGKLICELKHSKDVVLPTSPSLTWHMREECLEIQLWLSNMRHAGETTSRKRDRLLGSAFVDVSSLLLSQQRKYRQIR